MKKKRQLTDRLAAPPGYKWISVRDLDSHIIKEGADCYPWTECFFWWPIKTINGKNLWWVKGFKRRVWISYGTGFHMEPVTQYGTLFDVMNDPWEQNG